MLGPAFTGFVASFSLILAIGAQNAFVLRQGIQRAHVFWLCLLCAASDAILITVGVGGFGVIVESHPSLPFVLTLGGAGFLVTYGILRLRLAIKGDYALVMSGKSAGLWATLATGLAFTWLNPHVYLDTLGLIGAISTQYGAVAQKVTFAAGAILASFVFFFSLGYGATLVAPMMTSRRAWRVLDTFIGVTMLSLAVGLVIS